MKKKSIQFVIIFTIFCYLVISLCSCHKDDNPVDPYVPPTPGLDTVSRYIWTLIHFGLYMFDIYAADTNKIFIVGNHQLLWYNGSQINVYNLNDQDFGVEKVYGYNRDNIFVSGIYIINGTKMLPIIKKITNGVISSYKIADTGSVIYDLLVTGPNQAWFSEAFKNKIYFFDNGVFSEYTLNENDTIKAGIFYLNSNNELYVFATNTYETYPGGTSYTYKYTNNKFVLQRTDCFGYYPCNTLNIFRCGKEAIMSSNNDICGTKYFNGTEWVIHSSMDSVYFPFTKLGGISKDSLVGFCFNNKIYTYNGIKWRIENNSPLLRGNMYGIRSNIEIIFGNVYFTYLDTYTGSFTSFVIGRPNKNFKN